MKTSLAALLASTLWVGLAAASDISIFQFPDSIYATAPARGALHRLAIPGGQVLASEANGDMARVDVTEGVNIIASIPMGLAGRQIHMDMGPVRQVELGSRIAVVFAESGTALYYPGMDRLLGIRLSDGTPKGAMVYRDIAALRWSEHVSLFGSVQGRVVKLVFPHAGMTGIQLGQDTVVTMWEGEDTHGTFLHVLTPRGFHTVQLSEFAPGNLSARGGMAEWMPIQGGSGELLPSVEPLSRGADYLSRPVARPLP